MDQKKTYAAINFAGAALFMRYPNHVRLVSVFSPLCPELEMFWITDLFIHIEITITIFSTREARIGVPICRIGYATRL